VVTVRLADQDPQTLHAATIGGAWLAVAGRIMADGVASRYDGWPVREISHVTLCVEHPDPHDGIIARFAEPERLAWMHANFTDRSRVAELGGADSYATRLFDHEHSGRDQVAWVIDRLRQDPATGRPPSPRSSPAPTPPIFPASACSTSGCRVARWS
jgi:thymidylate synthase